MRLLAHVRGLQDDVLIHCPVVSPWWVHKS